MARLISWVVVVVTLLALPGSAWAGEGLYSRLPDGVPELVALVIVFGVGWLLAGRKGAVDVTKAQITGDLATARAELDGEVAAARAEMVGEMARLEDRIKDTRSWVGGVSKRSDERRDELQAAIEEVRAESATQQDVAHLQAQFDELRAEVVTLKAEVAEVKADVAEVKTEVAAVHSDTTAILAILGDSNG